MTIKITSPSEGYTGTGAYGPVVLGFSDGVAQVDELSDGLRAYLEDRGYTVEDGEGSGSGATKPPKPLKPPKPVDVPDGEPAEAWTHDQLDAYAAAKGLKLPSGLAKGDKVAAILEAETSPEDDDVLGEQNPEG